MRIPIRIRFAATPNGGVLQPVLAKEVVRYVGEPVAVVVAEDPWAAEDAAEPVELELDGPDSGRRPRRLEHRRAARSCGAGLERLGILPFSFGDTEAAFASADVSFAAGSPGAADWVPRSRPAVSSPSRGRPPDGQGAAKVKHFNRGVLAALLGLDPESVRLVEVDVGGGFGVRGEFYPEDGLVPFLALTLGRAVKWVEDRAEHLVATNHSREQVHDIAGRRASRTARCWRSRDRLWCDLGAYARTHGVLPAILPGPHLPGPYAWDAFSVDLARGTHEPDARRHVPRAGDDGGGLRA